MQLRRETQWRDGSRRFNAGRLNPRVTADLVPFMSLQLRAIEVADLEPRLKKLEQEFSREPERWKR
jgi:hypothetical protein